jgi:hypothetical protein
MTRFWNKIKIFDTLAIDHFFLQKENVVYTTKSLEYPKRIKRTSLKKKPV